MGLRGPIVTPSPRFGAGGSFPGGTRGTAEAGHVRSSEGAWVDFVIGELLRAPVPVGPPIDRRDVRKPSGVSIPTLVSVPVPRPSKGIFKEDIGGGFPQIKGVLPVPIASPLPVIPQVRTGPSTTVGGPSTTKIHTGADMANDLGTILTAIGNTGIFANTSSDIFDMAGNIFGGSPVATAPPAVIIPAASPAVAQPSTPSFQGGTFGGGCEADPRKQYVMKFLCGEWKWVKKRKRRSKRLATASDIKDLSALQGVLGNGKNLTTWIATHR